MIIAIDGPAGVGKSTVAQKIAQELSFVYLNSGYIYRAVTVFYLQDGLSLSDVKQIEQYTQNLKLRIENNNLIIDEVRESDLRSALVDKWVAPLSSIPSIRYIVNGELRKLSENRDVVVEGRDMTTVVFPEARFKFYLDANPTVRAKRRFLEGLEASDPARVEEEMRQRDKIDANKKVGSLKISPKAFYLDTSDLTLDEVCATLIRKINDEIREYGS